MLKLNFSKYEIDIMCITCQSSIRNFEISYHCLSVTWLACDCWGFCSFLSFPFSVTGWSVIVAIPVHTFISIPFSSWCHGLNCDLWLWHFMALSSCVSLYSHFSSWCHGLVCDLLICGFSGHTLILPDGVIGCWFYHFGHICLCFLLQKSWNV